jgi:hypothetical protein
MENKFVAPESIAAKLGKKNNFYQLLTVDSKFIDGIPSLVHLFLPPFDK